MLLGEAFKEIQKDPKASSKQLKLPCCKMDVNLYSSVIKKDMKSKQLKKSKTNNRYDRARPEQTDKGSGLNFVIKGTDK